MRKHLVLVAAVLLALGSSAEAAPSGPTGPPPLDNPITVDAPECGGKGFSKVELNLTRADFGCVHTADDAPDAGAEGLAMALTKKPAEAKVPCYGDGTTGPRIQMIYGYFDGLPNRGTTVTKLLRTVIAPRMQAVINNQSHGKDLGLRFMWTKGCGAIDLKVIKFPRSVQYGPSNSATTGGQLGRAADHLASLGLDRDDRKYQILWDGWSRGECGSGFLFTDQMSIVEAVTNPYRAAYAATSSMPHSPWSEGLPTLGARTDPAVHPWVRAYPTAYSIVYNHAGGPNGPSCFTGKSLSTVTTVTHELFHNLGAVQLDAPHADTGHCSDAPSVMCSGGSEGYGLGVYSKQCGRVLVETLDCGEDDYWNPDPKPDNYLATHLNIAKSQFFGQQVQDLLVASPK